MRQDVGSHEIDVYATRGDETLVVECKDWGRKVSKDPMRTVHNNAMEIEATPGLAFTSELTSGAEELANDYDILLFPSDVVRGNILTLEDVRDSVRRHSISLPNVSNLSELDDPFGSFSSSQQFPEDVASEARRQSFEMDGRHEDATRREIERLLSERDESQCVPILRNDRAKIDLYFIADSKHDALPRPITKRSVTLN